MTKRKRIVVIGGSAAGPKAAAKARRIDNNAEVIILQKDADLSMASCGYPYYVGGYFNDRNMLLCTPTGVVIPICIQDDTVIYSRHGGVPCRERFKSVLKTYKEPSSYVIKRQQ